MKKHDIARQLVDIQTLLDITKDNVLENKPKDALIVLQSAIHEMKKIAWRITPEMNH